MNRKSLIVTGVSLAALLGGAAGAYFYVDHKKTSEEALSKAETEALKLLTFNSTDVNSIDITNADGHFHVTLGQTGDWVIEDSDYPYSFTLNSYFLNVVAASMGKLTADHKADPADLSKYGLDSPVTVVCHTPDSDYTILVGNSTATNEFRYVKLPDDDTVYCIDDETGKSLRCDLSDLRSPYLLNCYDSEIQQFSVVHNGETSYDLSRDTESTSIWKLNSPQTNVAIDSIIVNTVITNMVRIQSEKFEGFIKDSSELAKYGLDKPAYTYTVVTNDKTITLEFPEFSEDDTEIWGYDPDTYAVFSLSKDGAAFLSGKWYDLTAKQAMSVPFMSAASLEIEVDGEKHTLAIDHENKGYVFDDTDVIASGNEDASVNFEYLYASVSEIKHDEFRDDVPEKMGEPTCTFRYKLTDGTTRELALVPIDDETYWAYIDGECFGMTVSKAAITGANGCLKFIELLSKDLGIENKN